MAYSIGKLVNEGRAVRPYLPSGMPFGKLSDSNPHLALQITVILKLTCSPSFFLSPFSFNPALRSFPPYSPSSSSFASRTSAIQASLIALGLASVLLSPFPLVLHRFKHLLRMRLGVDLLGGKDVGDSARFVGYEGGAKGAHVLASAH